MNYATRKSSRTMFSLQILLSLVVGCFTCMSQGNKGRIQSLLRSVSTYLVPALPKWCHWMSNNKQNMVTTKQSYMPVLILQCKDNVNAKTRYSSSWPKGWLLRQNKIWYYADRFISQLIIYYYFIKVIMQGDNDIH